MKRFVLPLLALALVASWALPSLAKDEPAADTGNKPVAVLTIASYERLMTDIAFIGDLMGTPDLDKNLEGMIQLFTQGKGLEGLDKKKPIGISLTTDGTQFEPLILLPVEKLKTLLEALEGIVGPAQDAGDGVFELNVFDQKLYIKEKSKYAYMSTTPTALVKLPADPNTLLGGLEKNYDIAGKLYVQNVPEMYRQMLVDQLKAGVEVGMARQPNETDEAYATRKKTVDAQIATMSTAIKDLEELTLGIKLESKDKSAYLDLVIRAVQGSDTAKQLAQMQNGTSSFAGFLDANAAASLVLTTKVNKKDAEQYTAGLKAIREQLVQQVDTATQLPDDASKKVAKEVIGQVFDAIRSTIESGKVDAGATLNVSDKSMAFVVGAYVADPKRLEDALKNFAKLAEKEPNFPGIKFNAAQHNGVRFHTTSIPVPKEEGISKVLGDKLDVAVGLDDKSVYLALGTDSLNMAKKLIDKSKSEAGKELPPFQLNLALAPIFKFAAAMQQDNANIVTLAEQLAKSNGKDKVRVLLMPQSNAISIRVNAEEGVLKLLGEALKNAQASGAIPGLGP